jgi:hypothetical protein
MESDITNDVTVEYADTIAEHHLWLQQFNKQQLKKWEDLLKANPEAAICEAETRKLLSNHRIDVKPYDGLYQGGPDFLCTKNGKTFYVEVTCITIDIATKKTNLPPSYPKKPSTQYYRLLTKHILGELCNKTPQCSGLEQPCIIAITTLHSRAGASCFRKPVCGDILTGTPQITMDIDVKKGHATGEPYQTTDLRDSAFIRFTKKADGTVEYARNPISAVMLCAFGQYPIDIYGLLHPSPNYPFDRALLPKIKFCRLAEGYQNNRLTVEWI